MFKIKNSIDFERKVDSYMWDELQYRHSEFKDYKYEDMRLLGVFCQKDNSKEYKRDFSFLTSKKIITYMEHVLSKKIYRVYYTYKATFKSDGYDVIDVKLVDISGLQKAKESDRDSALFKLSELESDYMLDIFIVSLDETEKYEYVKYSYFLNWFEEEDDDDEDIE